MELLRLIICAASALLAFSEDPGTTVLENQKHLQGDLKIGLQTRNGVIGESRKWRNGVIPYEIRSSYSDSERRLIEAAMRRIEQTTCIKFTPRNGQSDYFYITNTDDGCYTTSVGYRGGAIEMSLQSSRGENCMFHSVIVHELLHVVGLWHEHMRYDRDSFVKIHPENVASGLSNQFSIVRQSQSSVYNVPYDYTSVMHYGKSAFSKDRNSITIEPLSSQYLNVIGRARDISSSDILKVNRMYNCNGSGNDSGTGTGVQPPITGNCADLSTACSAYVLYCGKWDLLNTHCRKTCRLC